MTDKNKNRPSKIPFIRRAYPDMMAKDLCSIQPMTGPVGIAFDMRYKLDEDLEYEEEKENSEE
jgi:hypothetical protein